MNYLRDYMWSLFFFNIYVKKHISQSLENLNHVTGDIYGNVVSENATN